MPLSCHQNQLNGIISTTVDEQEGDTIEGTNTTAWKQVRGTKQRKINKVQQYNNPPEISNNN
jgi:hypothetical protein